MSDFLLKENFQSWRVNNTQMFLLSLVLGDDERLVKAYSITRKVNMNRDQKKTKRREVENPNAYNTHYGGDMNSSASPMRNTHISFKLNRTADKFNIQ